MNEKIDAIIQNEQEWRRHLLQEVQIIRNDMSSLKIKVAAVSGAISFVVAIVYKKMGL